MKKLLYFGCIREVGHYWFGAHDSPIPHKDELRFPIDGVYTPKNTTKQGEACETILGEYRIISWHDYTVDERGGCNSNLVGLGYETKEEMLADAVTQFPSVMRRQPKPLNFAGEKKA